MADVSGIRAVLRAGAHARTRTRTTGASGASGARAAGACAVGLALAGALAGCGAGEDERSGLGRPGGTLRIVGGADVEHLDPASASDVHAHGLNRVFARTLFATRSSNNFEETLPVQADLAEQIPSRENGGISKDGRTYTVRLRKDVRWNTSPARAVVAGDVVRGFKRLCNPAAPSGYRDHYIATIKGMESFCRGYAEVDDDDAEAMATYQDEHSISGLKATDDSTLVFRLTRPASDFLNILALPSAAAAPEEYDRYVPDSRRFRRNIVSNGPYRIASYEPGRSYVLEHNPAWRADTDPLRERFADRIQITLGVDSADEVQRRIEQGAADLSWDRPVPVPAIERLRGTAGFAIRQTPGTGPYLLVDVPDPRVRQALQYAVDRTALIAVFGGHEVARPLHTLIAPGNAGYFEHNPYPTPGDAGDPGRCRDLLAEAGHRNGPKLTLAHRDEHEKIAKAVRESLGDCGIEVTLRQKGGDLTLISPDPDWYGLNGRSALAPLLDGHPDPRVGGLAEDALTARNTARATGLWNQLDRLVMQNATVVPLVDRAWPIQRSTRVRDALFLPSARTYDYTRLWLADT
ncbi:peptide/nickel transport system substrate-binding protein [Thermomonospora echinospora]|uniref:Peptide/nickel transport system substrate-binding protein n=1 Tax=Thermomonospora echinospora TaxID=1992 RepID=A0A1H6DCQ9_9ACTN|nr:ABC transporter substrate-binding protein [Thermomonospora echinospora]SEG83080.1 peptide/nickel transport system substrate-binding protein [Thermomonospora echinospora]